MSPSLASRIETAHAALFGDGRLDAIGEFFAPDYVVHLTGKDGGGPAWVRRFLVGLRRAFPDLRVVELEVLVQAKDRVAWQRTLAGTHRGAFQGFPATGRRIVWRDVVTSRFARGRIAEDWAISDLAERLLRARKR